MSFAATIPGTNGRRGARRDPRDDPGATPLSESGREYLERLRRETDASIRQDIRKYGEVRRWRWALVTETTKYVSHEK